MRTFDSRTSNDAEEKGAIFRTLPVSLAPSLLVAQQMPRIAANIILTGLLALDDSSGNAHFDRLRMRHRHTFVNAHPTLQKFTST
jgi:hypothetical protein